MQHLDGVTPEAVAVPTKPSFVAPSAPVPSPELQKKANSLKKMLMGIGIVVYVLYALWCGVLLSTLPSSNPGSTSFVDMGVLTSIIAAAGFIGFLAIAFLRISKADVSIATRKKSLIRAAVIVAPGLVLSAVVPFIISGPPPLSVEIIYPTSTADFIAPLSITFSAEKATTLLKEQGLRPIRYTWDFEGDGQPNDETVLPTSTGIFEKSGVFTVSVKIDVDGGEFRTIRRRVTIPTAVFAVSPVPTIVERPVRFSVTHLLADPKLLSEIAWDFDGDGQVDSTVKTPDVAHTYYTTGRFKVTATIKLSNQSQRTLERNVDVVESPPLPFPITLITEPATLIGPVPFGAGFRLETTEKIREVHWTFGDGKEERGASLTKVLHSFLQPGIYPVKASVRSGSGELAELTVIVKVTPTLQLGDLRFEAQPQVRNNALTGNVPFTVKVTPVTVIPLIQFTWEAPGAAVQTQTGNTLIATYRKEGNYQLTLIAEDPEGKALRMPIAVKANPPEADVSIDLRPTTGTAPLRVTFDASNSYIPPGQSVIGYEWKFGDETQGAEPELGLARTEHVYRLPGEYTVSVRIVLAEGKEYTAETKIVVRRPTLSACITQSRDRANAGGAIEFDASSCGTGIPLSYLWDVRSVTSPTTVIAQSALEKYAPVFEEAGTYTITLTIKDQFGNQSVDSTSVTISPAL